MRDLNEFNITDEVLDSLAAATNDRLRTIMSGLVRHLHDFAREVELTPAEWLEGIQFLTAIGQQCAPNRQEFILFSDTLGLSTLVNAMQNRTLSESDTVFGVSRSLVVEVLPPSADSAFPSLPRIGYDFRLTKARATGTQRVGVGADPATTL